MRTVLITEGSTTIEVPLLDENADYPPSSAEVFFNPSQGMSRDITVAAMQVLGEEMSYLDALAATGIRGLRLANEVDGLEITLCDWNTKAVELMRKNARRVRGRVNVVHADATVLMREKSFDVVDIDPFGSPAPFLDCAAKCARRFLWITATDKAPLCGAHPKAALRKYAAHPITTEYHAEVGLRTLLYAIACALARYQKAMTPLLSFSTIHYYRTLVRVEGGRKKAYESMQHVGHIHHCHTCGYRRWQEGFCSPAHACPVCGDRLQYCGPLWLGAYKDDCFCEQTMERLERMGCGAGANMMRLLKEELHVPTCYDCHVMARRRGTSPPGTEALLERLRAMGYRASRTHYGGTLLKCDAPSELMCTLP